MKKKRRVKITVEHRTLVLRRPSNEAVVFCPHCASPTIAPEQAAALANVSVRAIYRGVEQGQLHFVEANETQLLICLNSLLKHKGEL